MDINEDDLFEETEFGDLSKKELDPRLGYVFKLETLPRKGDVESFRIKCFDKEGVIAGSTHIYRYPDHLKAAEVLVSRRHRRQGIASAMYRQAEKYTGLRMVPSGVMTQDGKALWGGMTKGEVVEYTLNKAWKGAIAGLALGAAALAPGNTSHADGAERPNYNLADTPLNAEPEPLHNHLEAISELETGKGKYMNHDKGPNEYWTAHGLLGLKPATAHDEWKRNPDLQKRFPGLEDPKNMIYAVKTYPAVYNGVANAAWKRYLEKFGGNPARAAYAWKEGEYAEMRDRKNKRPRAWTTHPYVRKFSQLVQLPSGPILADAPIQKSLKDIEIPQGDDGRYDYSHALSQEMRDKGYKIVLDDGIDSNGQVAIEAALKWHDPENPGPYGHFVGTINGHMNPQDKKVNVATSLVHPEHRDQGLGTSLYEAFLAHAHNKLGATHTSGGVHSSLSHAVHKKVAAKHGLTYDASHTGTRLPPPDNEEEGAYDDAFDGYEYRLR